MKKIALGCDHAGFSLKKDIVNLINKLGHDVIDHGCLSEDRVDYPDFAALVSKELQSKTADCGILICGTGIGMAITANKFKGVRAASVTDIYSCSMTRKHNDLNVLCLGSRVVGPGLAEMLVETFLTTEFEGGRHKDRVEKISQLEK